MEYNVIIKNNRRLHIMTSEEKREMYLEKKKFVENLNDMFQIEPRCPTIEGVVYEVYSKTLDPVLFPGVTDFREWVIVYYTGGGWAPKLVSGNSNIANFKVIGSMLTGGCYEEVRMYQEQETNGYEKVEL
jgi:hypothetical protein